MTSNRWTGAAAASVLLLHGATARAAEASLESRLVAQGALLEQEYQYDIARHPLRATEYGDFRYNDRLEDYSLAAIRSEHRTIERFLARLNAIPTDGFPEQDELSHEIMRRLLQQQLDDFGFREYEMPVNQMDGVHVELADLPLSMPFDSVRHYEDYLARLRQIPRAFAQTKQVLRAGLRDRLVPVGFLLRQTAEECRGIAASDPFLQPLERFPDAIGAEQRQRLSEAIGETVTGQVLPAYRDLAAFIATDYAPRGRTRLGINTLPGGDARYRNDIRAVTSVHDLSPAQIHELGLREVERIESEMSALAHSQGYPDTASYRTALNASPKYRPTSAEQILDDYRHYLAQMQPKLPQFFGVVPASPLTVEAIPPFEAGQATHYQVGTLDGSRPGRIVVATSDYAHRSLLIDEATAYHEGVPGHHLQLSLALQLATLPKFRQHLDNSGYVEGWALYAEQLGKEAGFYQDPGSDFGRLSSELHRAMRLVVDTGIHSMGWSREQVVDYFRRYQAIDEPLIQTETDRYIALPGQALSYKLGQLRFRALRERAQRALGADFDLRAFHDEMLNAGVLPLDLLEERTDRWIEAQQRRD